MQQKKRKSMSKTVIKKESEVVQQPVAQMETPKQEMSMMEKIKLLGDLANTTQNKEVVDVLSSLPNGNRIYDLFVHAINEEISRIMDVSKPEEKNELSNTIESLRAFQTIMNDFTQNMKGLHTAQLIQVLNMLNQKLSGKAAKPQQQRSGNKPDYILPEDTGFVPLIETTDQLQERKEMMAQLEF